MKPQIEDDIPVIPERTPDIHQEDKGVKCGKCGMVWKGVMSYSCPHTNCPIQPKSTC